LSGLPLVEDKIRRRNAIAAMYSDLLSSLPGVRFQKVRTADTHTYKDYSIHVTPQTVGLSRERLADALQTENVPTKKYFHPPLHQQFLYSRFYDRDADDLTQTEFIADGILSLPIYESLPDETVCAVAELIQRIVRSACERKAS
jgi:dTDP-4-amino-4,6-dideoxygalactose transaminase